MQYGTTTVLFGFFALLGFTDAALAVTFVDALDRLDLNTTALARALLLGTLAALPFLWWGGRWLASRDKRPALVGVALAVPLVAAATLLAPTAGIFLTGVALVMLVSALLDATVGACVLERERPDAPGLLGRVTSGFAVGAVAGAGLAGTLAQHGGSGLLVLPVAVAGLLLAARARTLGPAALQPQPRPSDSSRPDARRGAGRAGRGTLALVGVTALGAAYAEGLLTSWGPLYLRRDLGADAALAGLLTGGSFLAFGVGALVGAALLTRLPVRAVVALLASVAAAGAALLVAAPAPGTAASGLLLLGACVAGLVPALVTWAARLGLGVRAAPFVMTCAYTGMVAEPLVVSLWGDHLREVLASVPVLLGLLALVIVLAPRVRSRAVRPRRVAVVDA